MTPRPDDDALTWDGDDDPTLDVTWDGDDDPTLDVGANARAGDDALDEGTDAASPASDASRPAVSLPAGYTAVGKGSESLAARPGGASADAESAERVADADAEGEPHGMGNAALVGIGIFAGVYLLLTLGWILGAARLQLVAQLFLEPVAFQITLWLAVLALPLWFATVFWLTSGKRSWLRFTLLAAGALLLIPWPFILAGVFR